MDSTSDDKRSEKLRRFDAQIIPQLIDHIDPSLLKK
jgi:hypothetical protein